MKIPRAIVVMGVSGSGKTTVGRALALEHGWAFQDADDLHPAQNIAKMRRGQALTDTDREPWLAAVRQTVVDFHGLSGPGVVACSALKEAYRHIILGDDRDSVLVYLRGSEELILSRVQGRTRHFMPPSLLRSQFEDLEEPADAIVVPIDASVADLVERISVCARLTRGEPR